MSAVDVIQRRLRQSGCLLLDGSMGQELQRRGVADDPRLWTATALTDHAQQVTGLHAEYIAAGADVITTHTYATNWHRFAGSEDPGRFESLNRLACEAAQRAAQAAGHRVLIAGSLPPLRESYRPDRVVTEARMLDEYARQARILAPHIDLFLCETLTTAAEGRAAAKAAVRAAREVAGDRPVWVSWTLMDDCSGRLRSGESFDQAVAALDGLGVSGLLVNCSTPESLAVAIPALGKHRAPVVGAYANGFFPIDPSAPIEPGQFEARTDVDPDTYAQWAQRWMADGANLVGGCCEVGPAHIARLRELIDSAAPDRAKD